MGVVMIAVGVMLFFGRFEQLATLGSFFGSFDEILVGLYIAIGIIFLAVLGLIPAFIARAKGRNFFDWWFFGSALFFVALPLVLKLEPRLDENVEAETTTISNPAPLHRDTRGSD